MMDTEIMIDDKRWHFLSSSLYCRFSLCQREVT